MTSWQVKSAFMVAWNDENEPSKGYKYLYLSPEDHERLKDSVKCTPIEENGETRFKIDSIVGVGTDIGVENLQGSGAIAGETARAWKDAFTLTYVSGRSVGIGAYLVRLGHRVIQKAGAAPILLTGYQALNKLMQKNVYVSNQQLGGPKIMYTNGVSHQIVHHDLEGVQAILRWLSYVPRTKSSSLPVVDVERNDQVDREIGFKPTSSPYDPRHMLAGHFQPPLAPPEEDSRPLSLDADQSSEEKSGGGGGGERKKDDDFLDEEVEAPLDIWRPRREPAGPKGGKEEDWISGFFDRDSFVEYMAGWAKTVITGRARLGGIPLGVIATENRTVTAVYPADPASIDSHETIVQQAGGVSTFYDSLA